MSLTEWLLVALAVLALASTVLLYFVLEFLGQLKDIVSGAIRIFGGQPIHATEHTQKQILERLEYVETVIRNWRDGR